MSELPEDVTLGDLHKKILDVLEINDVVQSDIAEIKLLLKSLVELQLALKENSEPLPPDKNDSMFS